MDYMNIVELLTYYHFKIKARERKRAIERERDGDTIPAQPRVRVFSSLLLGVDLKL